VAAETLVRVEKGEASEVELAALTTVLVARAIRPPPPAALHHPAASAGWHRPDLRQPYRVPHSWRR
jgi:hypothetical protein